MLHVSLKSLEQWLEKVQTPKSVLIEWQSFMSNVTLEMLQQLADELTVAPARPPLSIAFTTNQYPIDETTLNLMGKFAPAIESDFEVAKLESALKSLSSDVGR